MTDGGLAGLQLPTVLVANKTKPFVDDNRQFQFCNKRIDPERQRPVCCLKPLLHVITWDVKWSTFLVEVDVAVP